MHLSALRPFLSGTTVAGAILLALQAAFAVVHASGGGRLIHFTPYAAPTAYRLNVAVEGRTLSDTQVRERYGVPFRGRVGLTPEALQRIVVRREAAEPAGRLVVVRLHVSRQGAPEEIWLWPQQ